MYLLVPVLVLVGSIDQPPQWTGFFFGSNGLIDQVLIDNDGLRTRLVIDTWYVDLVGQIVRGSKGGNWLDHGGQKDGQGNNP